MQHHLGAVSLRRLLLDQGRSLGHHDLGVFAELAGGVGHGLGMVPHGRGDHALVLHLNELVERAPHLEGARLLQVLKLQVHVGAREEAQGI